MSESDPFNGLYIGCHASITPSISDAIKYVYSIGGNALQIFAGSNRSSGLSSKQPVSDEEAAEIRQLLKERNMHLNIHAIYLLNFCTAGSKSPKLEYARRNLEYDLQLAQRIGANSVVLHLGNHLNKHPIPEAESNQITNILEVLHRTSKTAPDVCLLLETPAGQGTQIGTTIADLARIYLNIRKQLAANGKQHSRRIGLCLDTAHIFSATDNEADIRTPTGWDTYIAALDTALNGKLEEHLQLIHLNDSKRTIGSRRDMHEGIGDGHIFRHTLDDHTDRRSHPHGTTLHHIVNTARRFKIPIILETHKAAGPSNPLSDLYAQELGLLATITNNPQQPKLVHNWHLIHPTQSNKKHTKHSHFNSTPVKTFKHDKKSTKSRTKKADHRGDHSGHPANAAILERLIAIRDYYDLPHIRDSIRHLAYARAVVVLQNYPEEIRSGDQVRMLDGIGAKIALKIDQLFQDGEMRIIKELPIRQELAKAEAERGKGVESVLGIGPSKASDLRRRGIRNVSELRHAVSQGKVALPPAVRLALDHHDDLMTKIPLAEAKTIVQRIKLVVNKSKGELKKHNLDIELAGSFAAGATSSKDVDILIIARAYDTRREMPVWPITDAIRDALLASGMVVGVLNVGKAGKLTLLVRAKEAGPVRHVDIRVVAVEEEVTARMYFTSGRMFNQVVRGRAKAMGYKLNEFGLFDAVTGRRVEGLDSEADILGKLGLDFIPLEKRRG